MRQEGSSKVRDCGGEEREKCRKKDSFGMRLFELRAETLFSFFFCTFLKREERGRKGWARRAFIGLQRLVEG